MSLQLGYALLRGRRISIRLIALGIGAAVVGLIELRPLESVAALILPVIGIKEYSLIYDAC
jgi:hypothetical protein